MYRARFPWRSISISAFSECSFGTYRTGELDYQFSFMVTDAQQPHQLYRPTEYLDPKASQQSSHRELLDKVARRISSDPMAHRANDPL